MSSSPQFTPAQVLNAARRAEAEGKLDYAAQFYRHIVDYYAATPEAQDAREGLGRLEWRRKEPPAARPRPMAPAPPPPLSSLNGGSGAARAPLALHAPREEGGYPRPAGFGEPGGSRGPGAPSRLPQAVGDTLAPSDQAEEPVDDLPDAGGYRTGRIMAAMIAVMGWAALLGGVMVFVLAFTIAPASLSAPVLGLPLGFLVGIALIVGGIVLVLAGQLAHAVFDNASAVRHLLAIEKAKALS
jgi:hypothetical protein